MLIIAGHYHVDEEHRDALVERFTDLVVRARRAPGCLDIAITADPVDPARVNNFERWASQEDLDAWREVADAPDPGVEMRDVEVSLYDASGERPPF